MASRAFWKGYIRLSLVTFPVELHAAVTDTQKLKLHKLSKNSGEPIHYKDSTESEGEVQKDDIVKGYEYEKGQYIEIEKEELDKLKVESRHTIDLVKFTDLYSIDPVYFDKPYFIIPDGKFGIEAYATLRDALQKSKKVALGQITIGGKERLAVIKAYDKGLIMETLRYEYEVRKANEYFQEIEDYQANKEQVALAEQLIKNKTGKFNPGEFKDSYQEGLMEIINAKLGHRKATLPQSRPHPGNVVNIMDALKRSLKASSGERVQKKPSAKKSKKSAIRHKTAAKNSHSRRLHTLH
jgi:DNA end-binding protein Ku